MALTWGQLTLVNFCVLNDQKTADLSGIAISISDKKTADIQIVNQWGAQTMEKVPSKVAYASENPKLKEDAYGFAVKPGQISCSWWKLRLCEDFSSTEWDDETLRKATGQGSSKLIHIPDGKTPEDVASDFLRYLYGRVLHVLKVQMGVNHLADTPILFNLTVPATWSAKARDVTRRAAIRAGFEDRDGDKVVLTGEPLTYASEGC